MYFLNTTRHLVTPASDPTIDRLLGILSDDLMGSLATHGVRSISWLLSQDGKTLQSFSRFDAAEGPSRGEHSARHEQNSALMNEVLGGLAEPQRHTYYRLLAARKVS